MPKPEQAIPADLPLDLAAALQAAPAAQSRVTALPPSHQRAYLTWIAEAKQPATRQRRIQATIFRLQV